MNSTASARASAPVFPSDLRQHGAAAPSLARKRGFFAHHGLWAPGVRLFRRMRFSAKAMIVSAMFLVPVIVLGWNFFADKRAAIEFSAKERLGVAYARDLVPVLALAQQLRLQPEAAQARELADKLQAQMKVLAATDARLGAELGTAARFAQLRDAVAALPAAGGSADAAFEAHTRLIAAALDTLGQSTDGSNLTLDPDLDTYYLMDLSAVRVPQMVELMARLQAAGVQAMTAPTPLALRVMYDKLPLLVYHEEQTLIGLAKVTTERPALTALLKAEGATQDLHAFVKLTRTALAGAEGVAGDKLAYAAAARRAIDQQFELSTRLLAQLDQLIGQRIAGIKTVANECLVLVIVSLLLGAYLFYSFFLVTQGGLSEVKKHLEAMTAGDLTTQPRPWGHDEAASLMNTLADMQASLRVIVTQVRGSSDSIVHASGEIAAASMDLSARTEQTASALEQSASSMEEISATVQHTAANARDAAGVAATNSAAALHGGKVISEVVTTMQAIHESSSKIGDIIGTIDGIAFQTNILALNAAVEAARAGEQGRGFAVVASEVRVLAQRSAQAAKEIKFLIGTSVERTDAGARIVEGAGLTMQELVRNAARMNTLLSDISTAATEESNGVHQVGSAVQELDRMTQQNAALVEQTAAAAASLKDQAGELAAQVARFRLPQRA